MEEPIFDELRTKQQLGYSVGCRRDEGYGTLSFTIFLQSASHDGLSLVSRVKGFIQSFACMLSTMDTETFNTQGKIAQILPDLGYVNVLYLLELVLLLL